MHRRKDKDGVGMPTLGVKAGIVKGLDWKGGIHIWCKRAVIDIPEGVERWEEEPTD
jgi:hypothetical protein